MGKPLVTFFRPAPLVPGQKIRIEGGPRQGDWEVVAAGEKGVSLRCPISGRTFDWKPFCYQTDEREAEWPAEEEEWITTETQRTRRGTEKTRDA